MNLVEQLLLRHVTLQIDDPQRLALIEKLIEAAVRYVGACRADRPGVVSFARRFNFGDVGSCTLQMPGGERPGQQA